ncbi:DUF6075 family protein [Paenibacillus mesophilus]|uniref:DUF6075 family protein n=1 Tax=Paenibacillus mesophilus TaxID=2582849 RepID=UPI003B75D1CE
MRCTDSYHRALFYTLGMSKDTRAHNLIVCTWLEYRFRQKIRDGLIDESPILQRRLAEIQRIRENMLVKDKGAKQKANEM